MYGPPLNTHCTSLDGPAAVRISNIANYPDQWDLVRSDPQLMPSAVNEVLRYDAPVHGFSRYVARDVDMDECCYPQGSRAIVCYGAANRDERKYPPPIASISFGARVITWDSAPGRTRASA